MHRWLSRYHHANCHAESSVIVCHVLTRPTYPPSVWEVPLLWQHLYLLFYVLCCHDNYEQCSRCDNGKIPSSPKEAIGYGVSNQHNVYCSFVSLFRLAAVTIKCLSPVFARNTRHQLRSLQYRVWRLFFKGSDLYAFFFWVEANDCVAESLAGCVCLTHQYWECGKREC